MNFSRLCFVRDVISFGNSTDLTGDLREDAESETSVVWVHSWAPVSPLLSGELANTSLSSTFTGDFMGRPFRSYSMP